MNETLKREFNDWGLFRNEEIVERVKKINLNVETLRQIKDILDDVLRVNEDENEGEDDECED